MSSWSWLLPSFASSLVVATSAATVGTVAAVSSLVSVDPGGASVQAILTFLACRSRAPAFGGTFQSWLATLPISPFLPLGLPAAALGNIALATGVTVMHAMAVVYAASRISHSSSADLSFRTRCYQQAAVLRFPSWSLVVWEFLLCGIAVCGASLASNGDGIYSTSDVVIGWISVTVVGLVLVIWLWITRRVTARVSCSIDSVPSSTSVSSIGCTTTASHLLLPRLHSILRPRALWGPVDMVQQYSSLLDATRGRTSIPWRWATVASLAVVSALTGAGGVPRGGCFLASSISASLLFATALCLTVVRPFTTVTENLMTPISCVLLAVTSVLLAYDVDDDRFATELAILGYLQAAVVALRLLAKLYLKLEQWHSSSPTTTIITTAPLDHLRSIRTEDSDDGEVMVVLTTATPPPIAASAEKMTSVARTTSQDDVVCVHNPFEDPFEDSIHASSTPSSSEAVFVSNADGLSGVRPKDDDLSACPVVRHTLDTMWQAEELALSPDAYLKFSSLTEDEIWKRNSFGSTLSPGLLPTVADEQMKPPFVEI